MKRTSRTDPEQFAFTSAGVTLSGRWFRPDRGSARALIVCLHGGSYTSHYFGFESQMGASLFDLAPPLGYSVLAIDRPGYGQSGDRALTFDAQAALLATALASAFGAPADTGIGVFIVGHSIGAMIAMLIAAERRAFPLLGLDLSGAGIRYRSAAARGLQAYADLPDPPRIANREMRLSRMFGPVGTYTPTVAEEDFATAPLSQPSEIREALGWEARVATIAPRIRCPLRFCVGEFDALWEAPNSLADQASRLFAASPRVDASVQQRAGHCVRLHKIGRAYNLHTLAFLDELTREAASEWSPVKSQKTVE